MGGFFFIFVLVAKKKKSSVFIPILLVIVSLGGIFVFKYRAELEYLYYNLYSPTKYAGFGTTVPVEYNTLGIDVSKYQRHINWTALSEMNHNGRRLSFAFIKATEGVSLKDPLFEFNALSGRKSRLFVGAYHFYRCNSEPEKQMNFFFDQIKEHEFTLPPVIDIETTDGASSQSIRNNLKIALEIIAQKTGKTPIIYTNPSFYRQHLDGHFNEYPFWLAHYYVNKPLIPNNMNAKFWQITDKATVDGINEPVDFNVFLGSYNEFTDFIAKSKREN